MAGLDSLERPDKNIEPEGRAVLILTRRIGETVTIGDDVQVTVLGLRGTLVSLGINAPKSVAVHREEIYRRLKREEARGDDPVVDTLPP